MKTFLIEYQTDIAWVAAAIVVAIIHALKIIPW